MILLRMAAVFAKPALAAGVVTSAVVVGWYAYDNLAPGDPTAFQQLQSQGERVLVSEFGINADTIVAVDPDDPAGSRSVIATIGHAPEYGAFATLSPDGGAIAYTALPVDAPRPGPDAPAIAGIIDADGTTTVLADDIDLLIAPVWAPNGSGIVVRKNTGCEAAGLDCGEYPAGSFELLLLGRDGSRTLLTAWRSAAVFPIGFPPDGASFYFATLSATGTDLYRVAADGGGETMLAHLSDNIARDWRISPDGQFIAYSSAEGTTTPVVVARVVDVVTGSIADAVPQASLEAGPASTGVARGEFNPAWGPEGELAVASMNLDGGSRTVSVAGDGVTDLDVQADQMDLPLAWAPSGNALVVRAVAGATPYEAGASTLDILTDGNRVRVSESSDASVVGWSQ
jgi:hypothetical protein